MVKALKGRGGWDSLYLKVFQTLLSIKTQVSLLTSLNIVVIGFFFFGGGGLRCGKDLQNKRSF